MLDKRSVGILILFPLFRGMLLALKALIFLMDFLFLVILFDDLVTFLESPNVFKIKSNPTMISFETKLFVLVILEEFKEPESMVISVSSSLNDETFKDLTDWDGPQAGLFCLNWFCWKL